MFQNYIILYCFIVSFYCVIYNIQCAFYPTGCAYDLDSASIGVYTCDYTTSQANFPIKYSNFSEPFPQRLILYGISGNLPAYATFDGWNFFNYTYSSNDHKNSLQLICTDGGTLVWDVGTFTWMNYLHELRIKGCSLTNGLIVSAFTDFGSLDHLIIEGCTIPHTYNETFSGVNITKMSDIPNPKGELSITNCNFGGGNFTSGFLDPLTEIYSVDLSNNGFSSLDIDTFKMLSKLAHINLAHNSFTTIPNNIFVNNKALSTVDLTGITFDCSCSNLWFLDYAINNYITLKGALLCSSPNDYNGKKSKLYYAENCKEARDMCDAIPGIAFGYDCLEWFQIMSYSFTTATFIISISALVIVSTYRQRMYVSEKQLLFVKKAKAIRVLEALRRGGGGGSKAPAKTDLPPKELPWAYASSSVNDIDEDLSTKAE